MTIKSIYKTSFLLSVFLMASVLGAEVLTLEQAEKIAFDRNIQLQIAEETLQQANAGFREALGNALPSISAYGQYSNNIELPVMVIDVGFGPQSFKMGSTYNTTGGISLTQPLFTGGALFSAIRMAKTGQNMAEIQAREEKNSVIMTVRTLYYQLLLMESLIKATEESELSAKANLDMVQKKYDAGKANRFEVLQAEFKYREIKPILISLNNQRKMLLTNFKSFLNLEQDKELMISGELNLMDNPFHKQTAEDIKQMAIANRNELKLLTYQKQILHSQRILAASSGLPKVSFSADLRHQAQANDMDDLEYFRSKNIGLSVSIPLISGGKNLASVQKANIELKKNELLLEQTINFILADVEKAFFKVKETEEKVESNAVLVKQAEEALRMVKILYENGSATQVELLNAESGLLGAKSAFSSSVFEHNVAVNQLKKSINQL